MASEAAENSKRKTAPKKKSAVPAKRAAASVSEPVVSRASTARKSDVFGGLAAREGKGPLWKFTPSNDGSFVLPDPDYVTGLYFPLFNMAKLKVTLKLMGSRL